MYTDNDFRLYHHGILGQKWGKRNGPPYPLGGGDYSKTEKEKIFRIRRLHPNSIYNKKHFDTVLKSDKTKLQTLSYDKNRTKNTDMFYASHKKLDNHQYNALFNKKIPIDGKPTYKMKITNRVKTNVKVASEDSAAKVFMKLFEKDRDFYNFVMNSDRMSFHFVDDKYKFKGYREAKDILDKMRDKDYKPTDTDLKTIYRLFNYVLPSESGGERGSKDVQNQRGKFFDELKKEGYGAVLDTNDAIYGGFKASSPIIVFDMEQVISTEIYDIDFTDKRVSELVLAGRKVLGI